MFAFLLIEIYIVDHFIMQIYEIINPVTLPLLILFIDLIINDIKKNQK